MTDKPIEHRQHDDMPETNGIRAPEAPQPPVEALLAEWSKKLDTFLRQAETSRDLGRELVEQRALNLDLQRQVHRLQEEVRNLQIATSSRKAPPPAAMGTLTDMSESTVQRSADDRKSPFRQLLARLAKP